MNIISEIDITHDFGYWLSGITDGEGSFIINRDRRESGRGYLYYPTFELDLRADDLPTLIKIHSTLGVGILTEYSFTKSRRVGNSKPRSRYRVKSGDCSLIQKIFERFPLRSKKARDFAIWTAFIREKEKEPQADETRLRYYFDEIRHIRSFDSAGVVSCPTPDIRQGELRYC